jgi:transcriptional regulator with XRE-family HTH domain
VSRAPTFREIGERIRETRTKRGLSQNDLAEAIGVTRPVVTKIENGAKATNSVEIRKIADYLGVSVEELTASIQDESLAMRFRKSSDSQAFLDSVLEIEKLVKAMLAQVRLKGTG